MNNLPGGALKNRVAESATPSEMIPLFSKKKDILSKGFVLPVGVTLLFGIILGGLGGKPELFRNTLGLYLGLACYYVVYALCGKVKPWFILLGSTVFTMALMLSPLFSLFFLVFYDMVGTPQGPEFERLDLVRQLIGRFVSTGMMEECVKIIPVLILWRWTSKWQSPKREKWGITEPLDGILVACASALGFVFIETLTQYGPNAVANVAHNIGKQLPGLPPDLLNLAGDVFGLQTIIFRIIHGLAGHLSYSGYFGYFVGLAAMKPKHKWKLLLIGWCCAAGLHAAWDLLCGVEKIGTYLQVPLTVLLYSCLIAAILKARQISPSRAQNFATVVIGEPQQQAAAAVAGVAAQPAPQPQPQPVARPQALPIAHPAAPLPFCLKLLVAKRNLDLLNGHGFTDSDIPGLVPANGTGMIAIVNNNPKDPSMLGLQNLSTATWKAVLPTGEAREIATGRSVRLLSATHIDFGLVQGEVR